MATLPYMLIWVMGQADVLQRYFVGENIYIYCKSILRTYTLPPQTNILIAKTHLNYHF